MTKISGTLLASITNFVKRCHRWTDDKQRYKQYVFENFEMCAVCGKPKRSHTSRNLPFFFNDSRYVFFCDKIFRNRSLDRIFVLDLEATQIIHGVIAVKYGISK